MTNSSPLPCYVVEWYSPRLADESLDQAAVKLDECAAVMRAEGQSVELLMTLAVPTDEVVFGVFGAESAEVVAQTCQRAGHPAERLTSAVDVSGPAVRGIGPGISHES